MTEAFCNHLHGNGQKYRKKEKEEITEVLPEVWSDASHRVCECVCVVGAGQCVKVRVCATSAALLLALAAATATAGRHQLPNQFSGTASAPRKISSCRGNGTCGDIFFFPPLFSCLMKVK